MEIYQNVSILHLEIQNIDKMSKKTPKDLHMSIICSIFAADFDKGDIYGFQIVHVCHSCFGIFSER